MLVAWIYNTLDESIRSTISFSDNVKTFWDELQDRYSVGKGPRIHELKSQLSNCKQRGQAVAI